MAEQIDETSQRMVIGHPEAISLTQKKVAHIAKCIGFDHRTCYEISMASSELADNILYRGGGGELHITPLPNNSGIQLESWDLGAAQLTPNNDISTNSHGYKLELIKKLMDAVHTSPSNKVKSGNYFSCHRFLTTAIRPSKSCPLEIGVASHPAPGVSNDKESFVIKSSTNTLLIGIINGLGNGKVAHQAAQKLRQYVLRHYQKPLNKIFTGANKVCKKSPVAGMSLVRLDWSVQPLKMTYGSIGNIEARFNFGPKENLPSQKGILGKKGAKPFIASQRFPIPKTLFLYSDGISPLLEKCNYNTLENKPAGEIARVMLKRLSKKSNATLMVVKPVVTKGVPFLER
jgi:phosphoserine phosphatase RsbX